MKNHCFRRSIIIPALCLAVLSLSIGTIRADDEDWVYEISQSLKTDLGAGWKGSLKGELKFDDDISNFAERYIEAGVSRKLVSWFELGLKYRYLQAKKGDDWKYENRPKVSGTFLHKVAGVKLSNRNQFEYRSREDASSMWRFKTRIKAVYPTTLLGWKCEPFVADEVRFDNDADRFNKNRIQVGISGDLVENFSLEVYYKRDSSRKNGKWTDSNILGTGLALKF